MVSAVANLANLAQTGTALATAGHTLALAKKKKKTPKDFLKTGTTAIIGTSFVRMQGQLAAGL